MSEKMNLYDHLDKQDEKLDQIKEKLDEPIEFDPDYQYDVQAIYNLAFETYENKDYQTAKKYFNHLSVLTPLDWEASYYSTFTELFISTTADEVRNKSVIFNRTIQSTLNKIKDEVQNKNKLERFILSVRKMVEFLYNGCYIESFKKYIKNDHAIEIVSNLSMVCFEIVDFLEKYEEYSELKINFSKKGISITILDGQMFSFVSKDKIKSYMNYLNDYYKIELCEKFKTNDIEEAIEKYYINKESKKNDSLNFEEKNITIEKEYISKEELLTKGKIKIENTNFEKLRRNLFKELIANSITFSIDVICSIIVFLIDTNKNDMYIVKCLILLITIIIFIKLLSVAMKISLCKKIVTIKSIFSPKHLKINIYKNGEIECKECFSFFLLFKIYDWLLCFSSIFGVLGISLVFSNVSLLTIMYGVCILSYIIFGIYQLILIGNQGDDYKKTIIEYKNRLFICDIGLNSVYNLKEIENN